MTEETILDRTEDRLNKVIVLLVFILGVIMGVGATKDSSLPGSNSTYFDIKAAKYKCEKMIPKNKECKLQWKYVPDNKEIKDALTN